MPTARHGAALGGGAVGAKRGDGQQGEAKGPWPHGLSLPLGGVGVGKNGIRAPELVGGVALQGVDDARPGGDRGQDRQLCR